MTKFEVLKNRSVIKIEGKDSFDFLQGILTNDIRNLKQTGILYSLILSPQGKFQFEVFLFFKDGNLFIDCFSDLKTDLIEYLSKFKLRSDVGFIIDENLSVIALDQLDNEYDVDPRFKSVGSRGIIQNNKIEDLRTRYNEEEFYKARLLSLAIPDCHYVMSSRSFPLNYSMDQLNAISFTKGCYIGQELTARMKHRNMIKRGVIAVTSNKQLDKINQEDRVLFDGKVVGEFLVGKGYTGICLLDCEIFNAINNTNFTFRIQDITLKANFPEWFSIAG